MGTAALTTRGMNEQALRQVAGFIIEALKAPTDESHLAKVNQAVVEMLKSYPVPADAK
jgi:glycine hydroxymethyltransferase